MEIQKNFKRYEIKYFLTDLQVQRLLELMKPHMKTDGYGKSTIMNLYFDTPNDMLIRHSLEKPVYKEKLRLRSYGIPNDDSPVFLEIKKKYKHIVYKRRESTSYSNMLNYLQHGVSFSNSQIMHEIDYFMQYYPQLSPHIFLSYEREAFFQKDNSDFRITFDKNILWRNQELSLQQGNYGNSLIPENQSLMEIKTAGGIPLWLSHFLTRENLNRCSFSKYGTVYRTLQNETIHQN